MAKVPPRDLFDEKTMTFGEHLEELRWCLWKAVIGLVGGLIIGLLIGNHVMRMVRHPIDRALDRYGVEVRSVNDLKGTSEPANNEPSDSAEDAGPVPQAQGEDSGSKNGTEGTTDKVIGMVDARDLFDALKEQFPETFGEWKRPVEPMWVPFHAREPGVTIAQSQKPQVEPPVNREVYGVYEPNPVGAFMVYLKVALVTGIVISSPWVLYQLWIFVAAGLYPQEKHYVYIYLPMSIGLFLGGAAFCFYVVFPFILTFLLSFNQWLDIAPMLQMSQWISFAIMLPVMFGIGFQLPLVMLFLERIGIFTEETYRSSRRVSIMVIAVISMLLTPADPYSMMAMMIPLVILYEGGIFMVRFMRRRSPFEGAEPVQP